MLAQLLEQGKLDVAVVFDHLGGGGLVAVPMVEEPLLLVGARGTLKGRVDCTLDDLAELPLLMLSRPNGIRETLERLWATLGRRPDVVAEVNAPTC